MDQHASVTHSPPADQKLSDELVVPQASKNECYLKLADRNSKIFLVETGGTLASVKSSDGASPTLSLADIVRDHLPYEPWHPSLTYPATSSEHFGDLIDSSNATTAHWLRLSQLVAQSMQNGPTTGVVVTMGTDTMSYAAAALSLLLPRLPGPVVITGAQRMLDQPNSDGPSNLRTAILGASTLPGGVYVAFANQYYWGTEVTKRSSMSLDAFVSTSGRLAGKALTPHAAVEMSSHSLHAHSAEVTRLPIEPVDDVEVVHLTPGPNRVLRRALEDPEVKGVVLKCFGLGGVPSKGPYEIVSLLEHYGALKPIVLATQCPHGPTSLDTYEVGVRALRAGVISAGDMSFELALFNLKVLLGVFGTNVETIRSNWLQFVPESTRRL